MRELRNIIRIAWLLIFFVSSISKVTGQNRYDFVLRNNVLYDAALTPNLGVEVALDSVWGLGLNAGLNAWDMNKSKNKKWRHVMVSPFLRHYNKVKCPRRCESLCRDSMLANCCRQDSLLGRCCRRDSICCDSLMACSYLRDSLRRRSFWSIHGVYSHYNVSGVRFPLGLYPSVRDSRRQGDFVAIGGSYGYSWRLSRHFFLEAELGLAVGYTWYKEYDCATCGAYRGRDCKFFLLPKLGLNLVWNLGRKGRNGEISAKN